MENLKLRVWDSFNEEMVYSSEEHFCLYNKKGKWAVRYSREKTLNNGGIEVDAPVQIESDEIEIMLSPGRKDINGKEIYEGDIMAPTYFATINSVMELNEDNGCYVLRYNQRSFVRLDVRLHLIEVIGNIHQNPELVTF